MAFSLPVWTTALLLLNPMMPPGVALIHFRETLGSSLVFGALPGWLLSPRQPTAAVSATAASSRAETACHVRPGSCGPPRNRKQMTRYGSNLRSLRDQSSEGDKPGLVDAIQNLGMV